MEAHLKIVPQALPLTKEGLPRVRPFRVNGNLQIPAIDINYSRKRDRKKIEEVKEVVIKMKGDFVETATLLKELEQGVKELPSLVIDEVVEV